MHACRSTLEDPTAEPRATEALLGVGRTGSDLQRLASPLATEQNPYEGVKSDLVQTRNFGKKIAGNILPELTKAVRGSQGESRGLMEDSLTRVETMARFVGELHEMNERVYAQRTGGAGGKGGVGNKA